MMPKKYLAESGSITGATEDVTLMDSTLIPTTLHFVGGLYVGRG